MRAVGIIAEYDPFHNGHLYHLEESMSRTGAEASVVLMSGCFTQRGTPATFDKRLRARAAVACGVDLVIELPFVYAAGNAEMFARGAVRIMDGLGVAEWLSFGSESGDLDSLSMVAALFAEDSPALNEAVREAMGRGVSYPSARERAVARLLGEEAAALMREPNNILAIEYLKELTLSGSGVSPVTIRRAAAGVGEANASARVAGASALRAMFREAEEARGYSGNPWNSRIPDGAGRRENSTISESLRDPDGGLRDDPYRYLPAASEGAVREGGRLVFADALFPHLVRSVISAGRGDGPAVSGASGGSGASGVPDSSGACRAEDPWRAGLRLSDILSATEGLENRLASAVRRARCMDDVVRYAKTRRYTETRVRRLILHTVMGLTKRAMAAAAAEPAYARVLAFSDAGARVIRKIREEGRIPVITNANKEADALGPSPVTFGYDVRAAEFYRLLERGDLSGFSEQSSRPLRPR